MEQLYKVKEIEATTEVDDKGIVIAYINAFNNIDSQGDVSLPGSFNRTIKNNFNRIKHLFNHDRSEIIGLPIEFKTDSFGLKVVSQLNMNTPKAQDVFANYKFFAENNRTLEHSIGAWAVEYTVINDEKRYGYDVKEWKLIEYSTVAFGANELTPVIDLKSELDNGQLLATITKMIDLPYSDERKRFLETIFNTIEKSKEYGSLILPGSFEKTPGITLTPEAEKEKQMILTMCNKLNNL